MEDMKSLINKIKFVAVEEFIADNDRHQPLIGWMEWVI